EFNVLPEGWQGGKRGAKQASGIGGGSNEARVFGLRDQFARRAKLGQSRGPEYRALEDRRQLAGSAWTGAYCGGLHSLASVRAPAIAPYGGSPAGGPARKGRLAGFRYFVSKGVGASTPWFPMNSMACPRYE